MGLQGIGTNASNITDLRGTGTTMGGSVGEVVSVGGEYMYGDGYSGGGGQVALGLYAPTTAEAHIMKTYTFQGSVVEVINKKKNIAATKSNFCNIGIYYNLLKRWIYAKKK